MSRKRIKHSTKFERLKELQKPFTGAVILMFILGVAKSPFATQAFQEICNTLKVRISLDTNKAPRAKQQISDSLTQYN